MKQLETIYQTQILNILKFYEDIGINLHINQFPNSTKNLTQKKLDNFIPDKEKKSYDFVKRAGEIDKLENLFKNYNGCNLKKTATNFVKFQGNKNADLLFIDGPPNTEEDKFGKSFMSSKGDLFKKMLSAIQLKMQDIFIVNSIPWRPPGNRYPTTEEIKICRPFIFNLIKLMRPKIVVCLGELSTNQILGFNQSIIKTRGKWYSLKSEATDNFDSEYNPYILPTLNISYLLMRPDMKKEAWEDMKLLRDKIRDLKIL